MQVIWLAEFTVIAVAAIGLPAAPDFCSTAVLPVAKFEPVMVTVTEVATYPLFGEMLITIGVIL